MGNETGSTRLLEGYTCRRAVNLHLRLFECVFVKYVCVEESKTYVTRSIHLFVFRERQWLIADAVGVVRNGIHVFCGPCGLRLYAL